MAARRRAALMTVAGLASGFLLTGCVPFACPAIGWFNTLTVQLEGNTSAVHQLQLCVDRECAPNQDESSAGPLGYVSVEDHDADIWVFTVGGHSATFTVRSLAADGTVLSDTEVTPAWVRVGGDARCGGPSEAAVTVRL